MGSHASSRRERRRIRDRAAVLTAAARLFAEKGFNDTAMTEIADAADFSVGKLYTLFDSKEDLFAKLVGERFRCLEEVGASAVDPGACPLDQLRQRMRASLGFFVEDPHFSAIFLHEIPAMADGVLQQESQRHSETTRRFLELAMDEGRILREDSEVLACIVNTTVSGLIELAEARGGELTVDWIMGYVERFLLGPLEAKAAADR